MVYTRFDVRLFVGDSERPPRGKRTEVVSAVTKWDKKKIIILVLIEISVLFETDTDPIDKIKKFQSTVYIDKIDYVKK